MLEETAKWSRSIFKKALVFLMVSIGNIVDVEHIKSGSSIRTAVIFFYLSNEGISILKTVQELDCLYLKVKGDSCSIAQRRWQELEVREFT